jgi:hypothetical protein
VRKLFGISLLLCAAVPAFSAPANLVVSVISSTGTPVAGAKVAALYFQNGNPDAVNSRLVTSDAAGNATFGVANSNSLVPGFGYQVVVGSQGFTPAIVDQFNNGPISLIAGTTTLTPPTYTVGLSTLNATGLGEIDVTLANATHNSLVFGQVNLTAGGGGAIAYGFANTDGTGAGTLQVLDVHFSSAGTYQVSVFDPLLNRSQSLGVGSNLNGATPLLLAGTADFTNALPPNTAINNSQSTQGGLSADIVVTDTNTPAMPVPNIGIAVIGAYQDVYNQWHYDNRGGATDQNGHFPLYGLVPGIDYYTSVFGGCTNGTCYQGSQSTAVTQGFGTAPGINDFFYPSSTTVLNPKIKLTTIPPSTGKLAVYVTDQFGVPFPQSFVSLNPDGTNWNISGTCGGATASNPALINDNTNAATGYALLTGLPSGNYQLSAFTQYGPASFNNFTFSNSTSNAFGACPSTQLRVELATATTPDVNVYDSAGNLLMNVSSLTVVVNVSTSGTGLVKGTLTFPSVVNLSASPIVITLQPQCNNGSNCSNSGGGFKSFVSASTGPVINYAIPVSSGQAYYMSFTSNYWGAITTGGSQLTVDLTSTATAVVPVTFAPAGRVLGSVRKPDGSVFIPQTGQYLYVSANGNNSWGSSQLAADGSFAIGGMLPGVYNFQVGVGGGSGSSSFPFMIKQPSQQIQVVANQDTFQDAYLDNAVSIRPFIAISSLPALSIPTTCTPQTDCPIQTWEAFAVPAGSPINAQTLVSVLTGNNNGTLNGGVSGLFTYNASTGQVNNCNGQYLNQPGFCVNTIPVKPGSGSAYDFYLGRKGGFDSTGVVGGARPNFVLMTSTQNFIVSQAKATDPVFSSNNNSTTTAQDIVLVPPVSLAGTPQAVLFGTFTISNVITQQQFAQLGGKFDNFLQYLPVVYVYDTSGSFRAAGLGVPYPPAEQAKDAQLKQAVANNDYATFKTLIGVSGVSAWGPVGYEIRGLTAGTTYNFVATSPNYPPFKSTFVLGAAQSTTTLNVNFDANPGATLFGLVESTTGAGLANAQVTVSAPGFTATTLTTDSGGHWSINGLSAGQYSLTIVGAGFVQQVTAASVSALSNTAAPTVALVAANATITGSVYTNNPICPAGSTGCAAFGRTAISGASIVAYDDTLNAQNPSAPLALYRAVSSSSGYYSISGISSGDNYKVFVNAPGYYVLNQSTLTIAGTRTGFDFGLKPKPLTVNVYGRPNGLNYEFQITNFQSFSKGNAWIGQSPFVKNTSTDVTNSFTQKPDSQGVTQLVLDYPLASLTTGLVYVMHLEAQPNDPSAALVTTEVQFGLNLPNNTCQAIDQALLGDDSSVNGQGLPLNSVPLDISGGAGGNSTALSLPAGGVIPVLSTSIPSMCMSLTDASVSPQAQIGVSTGAFVSGVYSMTLSSINYTQKGVDLTVSYNQNGTNINDAAVFTFDATQQKWQSVPGVQTLDPVKGTITVKGLKSLASVLSLKAPVGLMALSDGRGYTPNGIILRPDDTGLFAVLRPSQVSGGAYTGTTVRIFNFPNPFSLQTKSVTLNTTAGVCAGLTGSVVTDGTVIKYEIPSGISGTGVIRIYTLSGRLVREVDAGNISASTCYYTVWDGKNKNGQPVANGVYYGVLSVAGTKQTSGTFKLAVIK